jgi:hypothetical protein
MTEKDQDRGNSTWSTIGLTDELALRVRRDQKARQAWKEGEDGAAEQVRMVDLDNSRWLTEVLAEHGWPDAAIVGETGARAVWLLAQHADAAVRARCLSAMRAAVERGQAATDQYAYLVDRVALDEGRGQTYGTQFVSSGAGWSLAAIEDPEQVDKRRAEVGLQPLSEYIHAFRRSEGHE